MVLVLSEINCRLLKERLKSGQNCTENQPLMTPKGLISRTRLKNGRWTWNFGILHKSTWRLCVPILSEIGRPSFPSLPRSLRQKLLNGVIFLDLKKVFDTVSHAILIHKLKALGVSWVSLAWFQSYLTSRFQRTVIGQATSFNRRVSVGYHKDLFLVRPFSLFISMTCLHA